MSESLGIAMRHSFGARLVVAATLALGECSLVNADSFKGVTPPITDKQSPEVAPAVSSSPNEFNPYATVPGPDIQVAPDPKKTIDLLPGHMKQLNLDWDIGSVHIGDENLIDVTPVPLDNRALLVKAISTVKDEKDKDKRFGRPVSRANFYVFGTDRKNVAVYEVEIRNYGQPNVEVHNQKVPNVEIHNQKVLSDSMNYECEYNNCKLSSGAGETPKQ